MIIRFKSEKAVSNIELNYPEEKNSTKNVTIVCAHVDDDGIFYFALTNNEIKAYDPIHSLLLFSFKSYNGIQYN
jgi:hypothetical protein